MSKAAMFDAMQDALGVPEPMEWGPVFWLNGEDLLLGVYDDDAPACENTDEFPDQSDDEVTDDEAGDHEGSVCPETGLLCGVEECEPWAVVYVPDIFSATGSYLLPRDLLCRAPAGAIVPAGLVGAGDDGFFYAALVAPELSMQRMKFGFSNNVPRRMLAYRVANPTATLMGAWRCERHREAEALMVVGGLSVRRGVEVFDVDDIGRIRDKLDRFFGTAAI